MLIISPEFELARNQFIVNTALIEILLMPLANKKFSTSNLVLLKMHISELGQTCKGFFQFSGVWPGHVLAIMIVLMCHSLCSSCLPIHVASEEEMAFSMV